MRCKAWRSTSSPAQPLANDAATQLKMVQLLAQAAGSRGMAGGQAIDLASVGKPLDLTELEFMHIHKTGALIRASVLLGAQCGTLADGTAAALDHYAKCIGLAFQVVDDVLDAEASTATLGKTAGKDAANNKPTYVSLLGVARARELAQELRADAHATLAMAWARPPTACASWPISSSSARSEMATPLLDTLHSPADLRALPPADLPQLAQELRDFLVEFGRANRRPSGLEPGRGGTDPGPALRIRHAERPHRVGCRPPELHPQNSHRPPRGHGRAAPGRRHRRVSRAAPKANTTPSASAIPAPRSRPRSAWPRPFARPAPASARSR